MPFENVLGIIGGIAIFLFGIKIMGNGIERLAGAKLKSILEKLTTWPWPSPRPWGSFSTPATLRSI